MMDWYQDGGMGAGGWAVMIVVMAIFWGFVVAAGVMLFRGGSRQSGTTGRGRTHDRAPDREAMDILDERFARGEVGQDEYEARRSVLQGGDL